MSFLSDIKRFDGKSLKPVDTNLTTADGKKYIEKRTRSGDTTVTGVEETGQAGLGFCPDFSPDKTVGVAMERLLVGSQDVAHDCSKLKELGVTHILNVAYGIPNAFTDDFVYLTVEMLDDATQDILTHYPTCERFIDQGRDKGNVLIHCNAGVSRSTSIAMAYVMHRERIPLDTALERLQQTRPSVWPNEAFMEQLRQLEQKLCISM